MGHVLLLQGQDTGCRAIRHLVAVRCIYIAWAAGRRVSIYRACRLSAGLFLLQLVIDAQEGAPQGIPLLGGHIPCCRCKLF